MADTPAQAALRAAFASKVSVIPQTLTTEQQAQARSNIGAISASEVPSPDLSGYAPLASPALTGNATLNGSELTTQSQIANMFTFGTSDITAGSSPLATGSFYFVYE